MHPPFRLLFCRVPRLVTTRIVACLLFGAAPLLANPFISEFMADNGSTLADEDGEFSDWIEIWNSGDTAGNLNGWFLTDDAANTTRWAFPSTPLAPGELLVVFASNKNRAITGAELHTNFKLSGDGEYLALVPPDGITPSSAFDPAYPPQFTDVSYGASPSSATIGYFTEPTPCLENGEPGSGPVGVVEFTPGGQVFAPSLTVTLSSATPGTTILFTTDVSNSCAIFYIAPTIPRN